MTVYLKQSTASQEVPLGYFVDSTDGNTEETALTIANTDIKLWKAGATTLANKTSGGATHIANGIYYCTLDDTDTNTLGSLVIFVHVAGALAVRLECVVLADNIYDSLIGGGELLQTNIMEVNASSQSLLDLADFVDSGYDPATNKVEGVKLADTLTTYTGNTVQTGDAFARLGAPAGASIAADLVAIEAQTDDIGAAGAGLTAVPWNAAWDAEVQSEVADALDAAVPVSPTADSINQRIKAIDDLTQVGGSGDLVEIRIDANAAAAVGVLINLDTNDIQTRLPAALVSGRMDSSIGAIAAGVDLTATMKASVNTEMDAALDTAIPGVPTADSVNQRIRSLDLLAEAGGLGDLAAILTDTADIQPKIGTPAGASVSVDIAAIKTQTAAIETDTQDIQTRLPAALVTGRIDATIDGTGMEAAAIDAILTRQLTEAYAADGAAPTLAQALFEIMQCLTEFAISGTTITVKKRDGSTTAMTFTINSATAPTSRTRAT